MIIIKKLVHMNLIFFNRGGIMKINKLEVNNSVIFKAISETMSIYSESEWVFKKRIQLGEGLEKVVTYCIYNRERGLFPLMSSLVDYLVLDNQSKEISNQIYRSYVILEQPEIPLERYLEVLVSKICPLDYDMQQEIIANFVTNYANLISNKNYIPFNYSYQTDEIMNDILKIISTLTGYSSIMKLKKKTNKGDNHNFLDSVKTEYWITEKRNNVPNEICYPLVQLDSIKEVSKNVDELYGNQVLHLGVNLDQKMNIEEVVTTIINSYAILRKNGYSTYYSLLEFAGIVTDQMTCNSKSGVNLNGRQDILSIIKDTSENNKKWQYIKVE